MLRFGGGWSEVAVVGDVDSDACFRFRVVVDNAGVFTVEPGVEDGPAVCGGTVWCCFCGEEGGDIAEAAWIDAGCITEGGALEYSVTEGLGVAPFVLGYGA